MAESKDRKASRFACPPPHVYCAYAIRSNPGPAACAAVLVSAEIVREERPGARPAVRTLYLPGPVTSGEAAWESLYLATQLWGHEPCTFFTNVPTLCVERPPVQPGLFGAAEPPAVRGLDARQASILQAVEGRPVRHLPNAVKSYWLELCRRAAEACYQAGGVGSARARQPEAPSSGKERALRVTATCPVEGCGRRHPAEYLLCYQHWQKVPYEVQQGVYRAARGQRGPEYEEFVRRAVEAARGGA